MSLIIIIFRRKICMDSNKPDQLGLIIMLTAMPVLSLFCYRELDGEQNHTVLLLSERLKPAKFLHSRTLLFFQGNIDTSLTNALCYNQNSKEMQSVHCNDSHLLSQAFPLCSL